jgi:hypothetical protein
MAHRLLKFWSLSRREKQFFCEAGFLLLLSYLCVRAIAFRHIDSLLRARWKDCARSACDRADDIKLVDLSLSRATNLLSWKSLCLSRSIAEFIMLRRRGIPAVIMAGVRFSGHSSLDAHAWVDTGMGVNDKGSENSDFTTVIRVGTGAVDR